MKVKPKILRLGRKSDPEEGMGIALYAAFKVIEEKIVQKAFEHYSLPAVLTNLELVEIQRTKIYKGKKLSKIPCQAVQIALHLNKIRELVTEDNTKAAVFETIQMMGQFARYQHLTLEKHVVKGKKSAADAKKGGRKSGAIRKKAAESKANEIIAMAESLRNSGTNRHNIPAILARKLKSDKRYVNLQYSAKTIAKILCDG